LDASCDSGRGEDVPVDHVEAVGPDVDERVLPLEFVRHPPVGGWRPAVEQADRGQAEGGRADGDQPGASLVGIQ